MMPLKKILEKIARIEFKTDAGSINFFFVLFLVIIFVFMEIFKNVKSLIWAIFFPNNPIQETNLVSFLIFISIFSLISILIVMIGERVKIK